MLEVRDVWREFPSGDGVIAVLKGVSLRIQAGEMVAIMGASGSGKSTLMNILGCLDRPSRGEYRVAGQLTAEMAPDDLARLRREHFGFIFQRYHLLGSLSAAANAEIPAIYAGLHAVQRRERAAALLGRLGLSDKLGNKPGQLSGGQQQRVSIARALMNGGDVILADEPTGALDSASGAEVMRILQELHAEGHTVILVTHDPKVAQHAQRVIEIADGQVVADRRQDTVDGDAESVALTATARRSGKPAAQVSPWRSRWDRFTEAFAMAWRAMGGHRLRTLLTMLGIIIGIASVVSMVALGEGSRQKVLKDISAMGTNTIDIFPGKDWGDEKAASIQTLNERDLDALLGQPYLEGASPQIATSGQLRYRNKTSSGSVIGVGNDFFRVKGMTLTQGRLLDERDIRNRTAVAVVDGKTIESLLGKVDPVGQVVLVGTLPVRIVGVVAQETGFGPSSQSVNVWLPYSAVMSRLLSQQHFTQITIRVKDGVQPALAEQAAVALLTQRHGVKDFFTFSSDSIVKSVEKTTATLTLLVSAIAVISLIVGGVGVMNIMLVSVVERTREIGIRIAVGARQSDILQQFLIEAVMVSLLGGLLGIGLALLIGALFSLLVESFQMRFSLFSILMAFGCSSLIGILFGYLPARNAARLDPVEALARE